jgi:hypothetical protein
MTRVVVSAVVAVCVSLGCSIQQASCPGGYCGVAFRPVNAPQRAAIDPSRIVLLSAAQSPSFPVQPVGHFGFPVNTFDSMSIGQNGAICTHEIDGFFRNKAANLGFDGVMGMRYDGSSCVGAPFIIDETAGSADHVP